MSSEVELRITPVRSVVRDELESVAHAIEAAFNVVHHDSSNPPGDALCLVVIGKRLLALCFIDFPLRPICTVEVVGIPVSSGMQVIGVRNRC